MALQQKPILQPIDVWASQVSLANKQKPNQSKIDTGWVYGEKPPHNEFNWWWELVGQMLVNIQQNGVPTWDDQTTYAVSAVVSHLDKNWIWKGAPETSAAIPGTDPDWKVLADADIVNTVISDINSQLAIIDADFTEIVNALSPFAGKEVLYQESWDPVTKVLQLSTVQIGNINITPVSPINLVP